MALKTNIIANYAHLVYVTLIGIASMPLLYSVMGPEAFGLIGFYTVLQTWFVLLDFGLTASLSRECARYKGGAISALGLRALLRVVERLFWLLALVGIFVTVGASEYLTTNWLGLRNLGPEQVGDCIRIMAFVIALRWMSGLSRGVLNGFERQLWTSVFGMVIATLRFPAAYAVMQYVDSRPVTYFVYQFLVALIEFIVVKLRAKRELVANCGHVVGTLQRDELAALVRFSISISILGIVTTAVTQIDKLLLSNILNLDEYGNFALIASLAGGVVLLAGPISSAVIPRMAKLVAESRPSSIHMLYSYGALYTCAVVFSVGAFLAVFAEEVLLAWTWNNGLAATMSATLAMYSVGNAFYVISSFPHYLQYAHGNVRIQLYYSLIMLGAFVPALYWSAVRFGAQGASLVWLSVNLIGFITLTSVVHKKYLRAPNALWLRAYVWPTFTVSLVAAFILKQMVGWSSARPVFVLQLICVLGLISGIVAFASSRVRRSLVTYVGRRVFSTNA